MEAPFRMDPEALPHDCGVVVSPRNFRDEDGSAGIWDAAEPAVTDMCWGHKPLHGAWVPSVSEGLRCLDSGDAAVTDNLGSDNPMAHHSCRARLAHAGGLPMTDPLLLALSRAGMPPGAPSQQRGGAASTPLDGRPRGRDQEAASHVAPVDDFCSMLEQLEQRRGLPLSADHCALCGDGDASLLDLEALLPEQQCQEDAHDVLAGHQSDESGCSISSRVSLRSAQAPALPAGCLHQHSQAAFQGGSSELGSGPHTVLPSVLEAGSMGQQELRMAGDADLCNFLAEACSGLASEAGTSQQQFGLGPADPIMRSGSASSCSHCLASAPSGAPSLQRPLLPGPGNAGSDPGGKRKRGRPRRYDTVLPMLPGLMDAQAGGALSGQVNGLDEDQRKKMRGAKPKYKFLTAEEAVAHRRERNRTTALASYERRKARDNGLKAEIGALKDEQEALKQLLTVVQQADVSRERLQILLAAMGGSAAGILDALRIEQ